MVKLVSSRCEICDKKIVFPAKNSHTKYCKECGSYKSPYENRNIAATKMYKEHKKSSAGYTWKRRKK